MSLIRLTSSCLTDLRRRFPAPHVRMLAACTAIVFCLTAADAAALSGSARSGSATTGSAPTGSTPSGSAPSGSALNASTQNASIQSASAQDDTAQDDTAQNEPTQDGPARDADTTVPASTPQLDIGAIRLDVSEDEELILPLHQDIVTNGSLDSVLVITHAAAIAGVNLDASPSSLQVTPAPDSSGAFTLRFFASNPDTSVFADVEGTIRPRTDLLPGRLQSSETGRGRSGMVRVYTSERELLAEVSADASGRFPGVQLPRERGTYVVQAVITKGGDLFGFVRTITVAEVDGGDDIDLPIIEAIPFDGLDEVGMDSAAFRNHVEMVTHDKMMRWDIEATIGVFIAARTSRGRFSPQEVEQIRALFTEPDAIPRFILGRKFRVVTAGNAAGSAPFRFDGRDVVADRGWIVIVPDSTMEGSSSSSADDTDGDDTYDRGVIRLNPARAARFGSTRRLVTYEAGRVLGMSGDSDPLYFPYTMMVPGIGPQVPDRPTVVDAKTAAILYDDDLPINVDFDAILGLQFDEATADLTAE